MSKSIEIFAKIYKKYISIPLYYICSSIFKICLLLNDQIDGELRLIHDVQVD